MEGMNRNTLVRIGEYAVLGLFLVFIATGVQGDTFTSSEFAFTTPQESGLEVVPASCPSYPHYSSECGPANANPSLSISAGAGCVVGVPFTLAMTATDPDGQQVIYSGVLDGSSSFSRGPAVSGVAQNISWTFSSAGTHTVQVQAIDTGGAVSSVVGATFSCIDEEDDDGAGVGGFNVNSSNGSVNSVNVQSWTLNAVPSIVLRGATSRVFWGTSDVSSCTVIGTNGDRFTGTQGPADGQVTGPINERTYYTLTCNGGLTAGPVVVNVLPQWNEF